MRYFLIFMMVLFVFPAVGRAQVKSYSKKSSSGTSSFTNVKLPEVWADDVLGYGEGVLRFKDNRSYRLSKGTVVEEVEVTGLIDLNNIFDFENGLVFVKNGATAQLDVVSFSDMDFERVVRVKEYGCYIGKKLRSSEARYFVEKHCDQAEPDIMEEEQPE